jgi:hypothetical protein
MAKNIPQYIQKNDLPCLKYVKNVSGAFGVASFLKNYVAIYKTLGMDDVKICVRCAERCKTLYAERSLSSNPRDRLLNLDGLDKEQKAEIRKFFTSNKFSKNNPPSPEEAAAWVKSILSEKVAYEDCLSYYREFNPDLDCCRLCPLSTRYENIGFLAERWLLRGVLSNPSAVDALVSGGVTEKMFGGICNLAGNADPSRDKPVFFLITRYLWNTCINHRDDMRAPDYASRVAYVSQIAAAEIPPFIISCGEKLPNALHQTIAAVIQDFYGDSAPASFDAAAAAGSFIVQYNTSIESLGAMTRDGVPYPADLTKQEKKDADASKEEVAASVSESKTAPVEPMEKDAVPSSGKCWKVVKREEAEPLKAPLSDGDDSGEGAEMSLPNLEGGDLPSNEDPFGKESSEQLTEETSVNEETANIGGDTLPPEESADDGQTPENSPSPADGDSPVEVSRKTDEEEVSAASDDNAASNEGKPSEAGLEYFPFEWEHRPFSNSFVCVPRVTREDLEKFCVNLDAAEPRTLTIFRNSVVGGMRPCRAKTKSVMNVELAYLGGGEYAYLVYLPNLGTCFYTCFANGDVKALFDQAFRYAPLDKYCYQPYLLAAQLRACGIVTIKSLHSLCSASAVIWPKHELSMEDCLKTLGAVPSAPRDGQDSPSAAALRYLPSYHRTYAMAESVIRSKGKSGILERTEKYDLLLSHSFLNDEGSSKVCLFTLRRAGDYYFPARKNFSKNGRNVWCFSFDPSACDAQRIVIDLLFNLWDERVIRKTDASIVGMGSFFVTFSVPMKNEAVLRDRINLMVEGLARRGGYRYLDYSRVKIAEGELIAPVCLKTSNGLK